MPVVRAHCQAMVVLALAAIALAAPSPAAAQTGDTLRRAEALLGQGRYLEAADLVQGSGLASSDPQAGYLLGFALVQLYRFAEAEAVLEQAIAARPGQDAWLHALAKARMEMGLNRGAMAALDQAIAIVDRPSYRYARAMCALNLGELDRAEGDLRATLLGQPDHADALYQLGKLSLRRGAYEEALPWLRRALAINPRHLEARYQAGLAELRSGRPEAAVTELEAVIAEVTGHAGALYNLGRALIDSGREEEGRRRLEQFRATAELQDEIEYLTRVVKRNPENLSGRLVLADKLLTAGRAEEALRELSAARGQAPRRAEIYAAMGQALRRLGREAEARQAEVAARRLARGEP